MTICNSKDSNVLLETLTTSLGVSLLVTTRKCQLLLLASTVANPNQLQPLSSAHSSRRQLPQATRNSQHLKVRQHSKVDQPDNSTNTNYGDILNNLKWIEKYVRTKRSRRDSKITDDTTSYFSKATSSSTNISIPPKKLNVFRY